MINDFFDFTALLNVKALLFILVALMVSMFLKKYRAINRQSILRLNLILLLLLPGLMLTKYLVPSLHITFSDQAGSNLIQGISQKIERYQRPSGSELSSKERTVADGEAASTENRMMSKGGEIKSHETIPQDLNTWLKMLVGIYFSVAILLILKLSADIIIFNRRIKCLVSCTDYSLKEDFSKIKSELGVTKNCRLVLNDKNETPFVWGFLHPVIAVPESLLHGSKNLQYGVLQHELLHVRNNDWIYSLAYRFCRCLYWINPFVWKIVRQHDLENEKVCDEAIASRYGKAERYAENLLWVAKRLRAPASALSPSMARSSTLKRRIDNLLLNKRRLNMLPITKNMIKAGFLIFSLFVVAVQSQTLNSDKLVEKEIKDSSYVRLRAVNPEYPIHAEKNGIEGYSLIEFDITSTGKVINPRVIESVPSTGIFDVASVKVLEKWLYLPTYVNGKAVETKGVRNKMSFEMDKSLLPVVRIHNAELKSLQAQETRSSEDVERLVKHYVYEADIDKATATMLEFLKSDRSGGFSKKTLFVQNLPIEKLDLVELQKYVTDLEKFARTTLNGDVYAFLAQIFIKQKDWPNAQLALSNAFGAGQLTDTAGTKFNLGLVFHSTHSYDAALRVFEALSAENQDNELYRGWRNYLVDELDHHTRINEKLVQSASL